MALKRIFDPDNARYTNEGLNMILDAETRVREAFKSLMASGIHPRDAYVALNGTLFEEMCDATINLSDAQRNPK